MSQDARADTQSDSAPNTPPRPAPEPPPGKVLEIELRAIKERRDIAAARLADIFPCK
jgi:hypothetical protein